MKALLDTGNHLTDPVNGAPVCIVSTKAAKQLERFMSPCLWIRNLVSLRTILNCIPPGIATLKTISFPQNVKEISIPLEEGSIHMKALLDTGNHLTGNCHFKNHFISS